MNLRSEKGVSTIDITVSIIVITLLLSVIVALTLNINSNNNKVKIKSDALTYAVKEIEQIKATGWNVSNSEGYIDGTSYYKIIKIEDAHSINESIDENTIRRATVEVYYKIGKNDEKISLSAMLINPDADFAK